MGLEKISLELKIVVAATFLLSLAGFLLGLAATIIAVMAALYIILGGGRLLREP